MATLNQAASFLAERAGKKTDITFIQAMEDLVVIKWGRFIANSLSKNPSLDKFYLQAFEVAIVSLDMVDECADSIADCCDKAFKTVSTIPLPIRYGTNPFNYVGSPGGNKGYSYTTIGNLAVLSTSKLTGRNPKYSYVNNFIYVFNKDIDKIRVEGVFSDPRVLSKFKVCGTDKPCYSNEQDFPIDEQSLEMIIKDIMANELRLVAIPNEKIELKEDINV